MSVAFSLRSTCLARARSNRADTFPGGVKSHTGRQFAGFSGDDDLARRGFFDAYHMRPLIESHQPVISFR